MSSGQVPAFACSLRIWRPSELLPSSFPYPEGRNLSLQYAFQISLSVILSIIFLCIATYECCHLVLVSLFLLR